MKHTPGPWEFLPKLTASENHKGFFVRSKKATGNGKWSLAEINPGDEDGKLGKANAALIAAAPDLLNALLELLEYPSGQYSGSGDYDSACENALKAIAMASGNE